jgi:hypothetical protein
MVATCLFSKMVEWIALPDVTAVTTAKALIKIMYYRHGAPRIIISDRGTNFTATVFKDICQTLGIEQRFSTSFHPQTDSQTERANKTLITMLRHYINDAHNNWEELLEPLRFAYINSVHSSTNETPFFLAHGRDPTLLIDVILDKHERRIISPNTYKAQLLDQLSTAFTLVRDNLHESRNKFKIQYDKRAKVLDFRPGDKVLLDVRVTKPHQSRKFVPKYTGPFRIIKVLPNGVASIMGEGIQKTVNICRLKPLHETVVWKDELDEAFGPIRTKKEPKTRTQATSTEDDQTDTYLDKNRTLLNCSLNDNQDNHALFDSSNDCCNPNNEETDQKTGHEYTPIENRPANLNLESGSNTYVESHIDLNDQIDDETTQKTYQSNITLPTKGGRPRRGTKPPSWLKDFDTTVE